MAYRLPLWTAAAAILVGGAAAIQTCFDFLADELLPSSFLPGPLLVSGNALVRRQPDGRIFSITLGPVLNAPGEPLNTSGFVCCHSGASPELFASDGMSRVFALSYAAGVSCTGAGMLEPVFSASVLLDPQILNETLDAQASSGGSLAAPPLGPLQCGEFNSNDCESEFANAGPSGPFLGVCSRCITEGGARPLRSRCTSCCEECPERLTCVTVPPGGVPAPLTPAGVPLPVPFPMSDFSQLVTLFSVLVVSPDGSGRQLVFSTTDATSIDTCCYEGVLPQLPGAPGGPDTSLSYGATFSATATSCSSSTVAYTDIDVLNSVLQM